jgi:hypothetical protein
MKNHEALIKTIERMYQATERMYFLAEGKMNAKELEKLNVVVNEVEKLRNEALRALRAE